MSDVALDALTKDLLVQDADLRLVAGRSAVAQALSIGLQTAVGEWFLDLSVGMIDFSVWEQKPEQVAEVAARIKAHVLAHEAVTELRSWTGSFDGANRRLSVSFEAVTDDGVVALDTVPVGGV